MRDSSSGSVLTDAERTVVLTKLLNALEDVLVARAVEIRALPEISQEQAVSEILGAFLAITLDLDFVMPHLRHSLQMKLNKKVSN